MRDEHRLVDDADADALETLDLLQRGTQHVEDRQRLGRHRLVAAAGQDQQAVGAAAQPYGHVVEPVEPLQHRGVLLVPLQLVDHRQLPPDEVLGAPADVAEHGGHVAAAGDLPVE